VNPEYGIKGYRILFCKDVSREIIPKDWHPDRKVLSGMRRAGVQACAPLQYGLWVTLERLEGFELKHGPKRLSFLFVGGEALSVYDSLYRRNETAPDVLAIIQCGIAFGNAWTDLASPEEGFAPTVLENVRQKPQFLLHGGWYGAYQHCCWPEYNYEVSRWRAAQGELGLWWKPQW
jgi:hypothetical protein